jgi:hypothetical protein
METKKLLKVATKFICEKCDYNTSKLSSYKKHLTTAKHLGKHMETKKLLKVAEINNCEYCNKSYHNRSSLWKHKQKCGLDQCQSTNIEPEKDILSQEVIEKEDTNTALFELIKQNQEFKELLVEQQKENQGLQKQLLEAVKDVKHVTNNTVNSNNKFNLNFFLNEQCKDAMNISDFLENMQLDMEDLLETGRLGYVNGISRIFINKLRELDTYKRPLHCTDLKRETLYIRDNDVWEKEENSNETLRKLVDKVANKNCKTMRQWTEENPNYTEMDTIENGEFMKLSDAILGGFGECESKQFGDKIIRNVIKDVLIAKNG